MNSSITVPAPVQNDRVVPSGRQRRANRVSNSYFDQTLEDYRRHWRLNHHLGMHCGYHDSRHRNLDAAVARMNRALADAANIQPGDRVLDAGCGIGGSAIWLAQNRRARVCGITINARQIEVGRSLIDRYQVQELVSIDNADFTATGMPDASFDTVWALESSCYAVDRRDFLTEAFRLLRPGGRLVMGDLFLHQRPSSGKWRSVIDRWCQAWAVPGLETHDELREDLAVIGWDRIQLRDITPHVIPTSNRMLRLSLMWWPVGQLARCFGLISDVQARALSAGFDQFRMRRRNLASYLLVTATKPA